MPGDKPNVKGSGKGKHSINREKDSHTTAYTKTLAAVQHMPSNTQQEKMRKKKSLEALENWQTGHLPHLTPLTQASGGASQSYWPAMAAHTTSQYEQDPRDSYGSSSTSGFITLGLGNVYPTAEEIAAYQTVQGGATYQPARDGSGAQAPYSHEPGNGGPAVYPRRMSVAEAQGGSKQRHGKYDSRKTQSKKPDKKGQK